MKRLPDYKNHGKTCISLSKEVMEEVRKLAREENASLAWMLDALVKEALKARALEDARYKVKTAELESLMEKYYGKKPEGG